MGTLDFPLVLERVFFTRFVVVAVPNHEQTGTPLPFSPQNEVNVADLDEQPDKISRAMVTMTTKFNIEGSTNAPYIVDMECSAIFAIQPGTSDSDKQRGLTITGHSVVYGAIREAVAWVTGRQPYGPLTLGLSVLKSQAPEQPASP